MLSNKFAIAEPVMFYSIFS